MAFERGEEYVRFLEDQVHRLNVELARQQRGATAADGGASAIHGGAVLAGAGPPAPFLLDMDGLPPLIHAYEEQVTLNHSLKTRARVALPTAQLIRMARIAAPRHPQAQKRVSHPC